MEECEMREFFCGAGGASTGLELALAHSFPPDYVLTGNRGEQVKQIGNSVPVRTAKAIVKAIFGKAV